MDTTCELADRSCEWKRHRGSCNPVVAQATQRGVNDSKFSMQILLWGLIPPPNPLFFSRSSPLWYTMSSRVQLNQRGKELLLQQLTLSGEVASSELYGSSTAWGGRGRCSKAEEGGREGCTLCRGKELFFFFYHCTLLLFQVFFFLHFVRHGNLYHFSYFSRALFSLCPLVHLDPPGLSVILYPPPSILCHEVLSLFPLITLFSWDEFVPPWAPSLFDVTQHGSAERGRAAEPWGFTALHNPPLTSPLPHHHRDPLIWGLPHLHIYHFLIHTSLHFSSHPFCSLFFISPSLSCHLWTAPNFPP